MHTITATFSFWWDYFPFILRFSNSNTCIAFIIEHFCLCTDMMIVHINTAWLWLNLAGFLETTFYKIKVLTKSIVQILLIYIRICTRLLERYLDKKVWNIQEERHFTLSTGANKSLQNNALLKDYLWTRYPLDLFPEEMSCPLIGTVNSFIESRDIFVEIFQINHLATKRTEIYLFCNVKILQINEILPMWSIIYLMHGVNSANNQKLFSKQCHVMQEVDFRRVKYCKNARRNFGIIQYFQNALSYQTTDFTSKYFQNAIFGWNTLIIPFPYLHSCLLTLPKYHSHPTNHHLVSFSPSKTKIHEK